MPPQMTDLPVPAQPATPAPNLPPETDRLIALYLRTLSSPRSIKTYNTEIRLFVAYVVGEIGKGLSELTAEDVSLYREYLIKLYASATAEIGRAGQQECRHRYLHSFPTRRSSDLAYVVGEIGKGLSELTAEDVSLYREYLIKLYASATA